MVDFEMARRTMVDTQLRPASMLNRNILTVMGTVPRENFVPEARKALAYTDAEHKLPGKSGRIMSAAAPFARLIQLADIKPSDVVLDVACGTGYSTAVLAGLAGAVVGVEDDATLVAEADHNLTELEIGNAAVVEAALDAGVPGEAPFDVIVIEGEIGIVPETLLGQLRDGGRLVTYRSVSHNGIATLYTRVGDDVAMREEFDAKMPVLASLQPVAQFVL